MNSFEAAESTAFAWSSNATDVLMPAAGEERSLLGSPPMIQGEAISSWLSRVANRHGVSLRRLCTDLRLYPPNTDIDIYKRPPSPERLALLTNTSADCIYSALSIGKTLLIDPKYRCLISDGDHPIAKYCPTCLSEDTIPHFRLKWRVAFNVVCQRHTIRLRTSCPQCGTRLDPLKRGQKVSVNRDSRSIAHCHVCDSNLGNHTASDAVNQHVHRWAVGIQEHLWRTIWRGCYHHPRFGTISSRCLMRTYLNVDITAPGGKSRSRSNYSSLKWKSLFGPTAGLFTEGNNTI